MKYESEEQILEDIRKVKDDIVLYGKTPEKVAKIKVLWNKYKNFSYYNELGV